MRTLFITLTSLSILLFISACGKDGSSGKAFIALDWDWYVDGYNDDNPSLPSTISKNFDYSTEVGTYHCEYICSDGSGETWYWEYNYTIKINTGEKGRLFRRGANGKNRHHQLFLHGLSKPSYTVDEKNMSSSLKEAKNELPRFKADYLQSDKIYHGETIVEEFVQDEHIVRIEKRMFTVK